jgi:crotonobetainyl-CoA:carnitine CoA-transferase CaiB-like acyl-CoA transferase
VWKAPIPGYASWIWAQGVAAPYCAMLLAMPGAEVIKLEPLAGDCSRGLGKRYGDYTAMSAHHNRSKRSLALDLKAAVARDIVLALATRADIVIEGFRPGVAARLGLGYDELQARNPRVLYLPRGYDRGLARAAAGHRYPVLPERS